MSIFNIAFPALRTLALGLLAAATLGAADARADDALDQARLKAAFVLNFMKFTDLARSAHARRRHTHPVRDRRPPARRPAP